MTGLPLGTVTLLFVDIEGSTRLVTLLGERYAQVRADYERLIRDVAGRHRGHEIDSQGDAFFIAFPRAKDALLAAVQAQQAILKHQWPERASVNARMGLHTGEPLLTGSTYIGIDVHRAARICAAGHGGQILLSLTTRDLLGDDLPATIHLQDLGEHRLKDLSQPQRLFQVVAPGLPERFPSLRSLNIPALPARLTPLIGREKEVETIARMVRDIRLVTLTGPPGVGKTRLSVEVAANLTDTFDGGVAFVDLAPLTDDSLVLNTIAQTLGVRESPDQALLERLRFALGGRRILIILDNVEHLLEAAPRVDELLTACPDLTVLATTRAPLRIRAEHEFSVPPLATPEWGRLPTAEALSRIPAVALFIERARAANSEFTLSAENAHAIAEVVTRLDGLPLALELAAARLKLLSPGALLEKLNERLSLLTSGPRDHPVRQRTLRDAIAWSYYLLDETEQTLFRQLAIFMGGFTLTSVEGVCGDGASGAALFDRLAAIVEGNLIYREPREAGIPRYRMLETLREFGLERLAEGGEVERLKQRHAKFFLALVEQAEPELRGPRQYEWLGRLDLEHSNVVAALDWALGGGDFEIGAQLAAQLLWYWDHRGYWQEGLNWLELALRNLDGVTPTARAKVLAAAGHLLYHLDQYDRSEQLLGESLKQFRLLADKRGIADTLWYLGIIAYSRGQYARTQDLHEESLRAYDELGDRRGVMESLHYIARAARSMGERSRAKSLHSESLTIGREMGHRWGVALALGGLGAVAEDEGDYEQAEAMYSESHAVARDLGAMNLIPGIFTRLAGVKRKQGKVTEAANLYKEGLSLIRYRGDTDTIVQILANLATTALQAGRTIESARLLGASDIARERIGFVFSNIESGDREQTMAAASAALGRERFLAAWTAGREASLQLAIDEALSLDLANGRKSETRGLYE